MSPIWKKKRKSNPISRFVNEIRSARHGESMVVQTGFPTSLVDLVVKNQSRLAKNKNLNGKKYKSLKLNVGSEIHNQDYRCEDKCYENEDDAKDEKDCGDKDDDCCGCGSEFEIEHRVSRRKGVITKLVKMLFVLILGLGTKKVAVAVTLSACVLLFVEFLLRSWVGWRGLRKCVEKEVEEEEEEEDEDETNLVDFREEFENLVKERRDREIENECKNNEDGEEKGKGRIIELESDKDDECVRDGEERVSECEKVRCRKKTGGGKAKQFRKYVVKKLGRDSKSRRRKKDEKLAQQERYNQIVKEMGKRRV